MWSISKEFDFCYGHRVWSQTLNSEFSLDSCLACRHLHGHQGKVIVYLEEEFLVNGMVTDFKHLNWLKKWIDDVLDHKFIIDKDDPLFNHLLPAFSNAKGEFSEMRFIKHEEGYYQPNLKIPSGLSKPEIELYEGFIVVPFVPTSENLAKWIFDVVKAKMKGLDGNIKLRKVEFKETPKTQAIYIERINNY